MRLSPLLAVSGLVVLSACAQSGEPLRSDATHFNGSGPRQLIPVGLEETPSIAGPVDEEVPVGDPAADPLADPLLVELSATVDFASLQAFAAGDAGIGHDRFAAETAAVSLANAAALVAQRVNEMHAATGGCEGGGEVAPEVNDAALFSALAAEAAADVVGELNPPSVEVCGCHCETVPGTVDEVALGDAIDAVVDAGEGCAATSDALQPL